MDSSHERPKRTIQKKLYPDFVGTGNQPPNASKCEKRLSSSVLSEEQTTTIKVSPFKKHRRISINSDTNQGQEDKNNFKTIESVDDDNSLKNIKLCEKVVCAKSFIKPVCFIKQSEKCPGNIPGYTSRWHHISLGEHYCNDCFEIFYRSNKRGYNEFINWKNLWSSNAISEPNIKMFVVDKFLPFWVQCRDCQKWRKIPGDIILDCSFISTFKCILIKSSDENISLSCDIPEEEIINYCSGLEWISSLLYYPYLINCPAAPFLVNFYPDGVGLSVSQASTTRVKIKKKELESTSDEIISPVKKNKMFSVRDLKEIFPEVAGVPCYLQPFLQPDSIVHANAFPPDSMTPDEINNFPQFAKDAQIYLPIRNLIIALWTLNIKNILTLEKCYENFICRGLIRIYCIKLMPKILRYLTRRAHVNVGIMKGSDLNLISSSSDFKASIIIIGAGAAGLAAARQLSNMGCKATILEAKDKIGGRIYDDYNMGCCVAKGAQIIPGCINNPISMLSHQSGFLLVEISENCSLIKEDGQVISPSVSKYIDFHFNALLDNIETWRKRKMRQDINLYDKIMSLHEQFIEETQLPFTDEEKMVLNFHLAYMEQACGAPLKLVSSLYWDENEEFAPQFEGSITRATEGLSKTMACLARGLDVRFNTQVSKVNYSSTTGCSNNNGMVKVSTLGGAEFICDYVIVTVPLCTLKKDVITFEPVLPIHKRNAINSLGVGVVEKVALKFPNRFWKNKLGEGVEWFGHVPSSPTNRGHFSVFYDVSSKIDATEGILVTYLTGKSLELLRDKSDKEIVDACLETLRKLFVNEEIADPLCFWVSRWQDDAYTGMSYTYMPVGCDGSVYDVIAESVENKIFFAGEATSRSHPQTVAGAYLSGIREACKILDIQDPL